MINWSAEFLLAALVVTSLATGGLLGLWAATSRWHWFARTMVVLGVLTPLLWRPIYEPFVTLLIEVAVIVLGVTIYRRNWPTWRFSVAGLMMLTVPVAVLVAGLVRGPEYDLDVLSYLMFIAYGTLAGMCFLCGAWLLVGPWHLWKRIATASCLLLTIAVIGMFANYYAYALDGLINMNFFGPPEDPGFAKRLASSGVQLGVIACIAWVFVALARCNRYLVLPIAVLIAGWPIYIAGRLSTPLAIPATPQQMSAAYRDMTTVCESPALKTVEVLHSQEPINWTALQRAVESADGEFARLEKLVGQPLIWPIEFDELNMDYTTARRDAARLWIAKCELAGETDDKLEAYRSLAWLWSYLQNIDQPGLLVDALVLSAIENMVAAESYELHKLLDTTHATQLAQQVAHYQLNRSSWADTEHLEQVFCENYGGWIGHLHHLSGEITGDFFVFTPQERNWVARRRSEVVAALLAVEFAIRAYKLEQGEFPKSLDDLVAIIPQEAMIDPASSINEPLIYRRTPDGYALYSRGYDGDDDDGRPCGSITEWFGNQPLNRINRIDRIDWTGDGDLSLEAYFAEEE